MLELLHEFLRKELAFLTNKLKGELVEYNGGDKKLAIKTVTAETVKEALDRAITTGLEADIREAVDLHGIYEYTDGKRRQAEKSYNMVWKIINSYTK